jgi:1,4-dihydroxy-2-naphthoyl-CoA hydrolase
MANDTVEQFNAASAGGLAQRMGIVVTAAEQGRVEATMPVEGNTQPYGLLHGGASAALAETIGSIAGAIHAGPSRMIVGVDLSCTHHRAVRSGMVTGIATALHEGGTVATYAIRIADVDDRLVCTARLTCLVRPLPAKKTGQ